MSNPVSSGLSRRSFLKTGAVVAGTALVPSIVSFRAHAKAGPGELAMVPAQPNPNGEFERLFLLKGDPLSGPIRTIVTEEGNPVPMPTLEDGERRVLRVLHFNDMHNHLTEMHGKRGDTHRFSQIVKMVKDIRGAAKEDEIVLFVSAGDDHTGSIFDELMGWAPEEFVADAGYRANSAAGVDIAVLGNHEFDRGAELLKLGIDTDADFPVLSANIHGSKHIARDEDYVAAAIAEVKGLRVGFIGLTTAIDTRVGQPDDPDLAVASPVDAARNLTPALSEVCDVIVVLSHCGYGGDQHKSGKAATSRTIGEGDFAIADAVGPLTDKPVVLIGGHSHTTLNESGINTDNVVNGVLITQANAHGKFLGDVAMSIAADQGRKGWFTSVGLHPTKKRDQRVAAYDPKFASLEQPEDYDQAFEEAHIAPMIKALDTKLAEVIGQVSDDKGLTSEETFADRYVGEVALANYMNDALVEASKAFPGGPVDLAIFNATGLSAGISKGDLTFRRWYDVMPYADAVHVATMTGAQLKEMLDNNAKRLLRPEEAEDVDMKGFVSRGFLHFSKDLRYKIALGATAADARAVDITVQGKLLDEQLDKTFRVAFNTYIALGAFGETWNGKPIGADVPGNIASFDVRQLPFEHTGLVYRNEVISHIRNTGTVGPESGAKKDGRLTIVQ
jgi:2',3'-cyclic-nucleotide 2'-phosphodiesterase (5'-nucleotidase family)